MNITLIAAMDNNNVIGIDGKLPWHIPADLKQFKEKTMGKTIVMGRKTFDSFNGKLLPGRPHVVITRHRDLFLNQLEAKGIEGVLVYTDVEEAIVDLCNGQEIMVIGGGEIYKEFLPHASKLELTFVETDLTGDTYFPVIDISEWSAVDFPKHHKHESLDFCFVTYIRRLK